MPRAALKSSLLRLAKYSGLFAIAKKLTARHCRILAYHGIWLGKGSFGNFLFMDKRTFARRMSLLTDWGYPVVALGDVVANRGGDRLPDRATAITIDDGWYGSYAAMMPVLEFRAYPATVYLTTYYCQHQVPVIDVAVQYVFHALDGHNPPSLSLADFSFGPLNVDTLEHRQLALVAAQKIVAALPDDQQRQAFLQALCAAAGIDLDRLMAERWFHLMNPQEVTDAAARGISFQLHTHRHRISHQWRDCLEEELMANGDCLETFAGRRGEHFCYPSGRYSEALWPTLEKLGLASATTTAIGLVDGKTPRYAMPRILDGQAISELEFEAEMSGFMTLVRVVKGFIRSAP